MNFAKKTKIEKSNFPIFKNNKGIVYLDNAATTQKPNEVIEAVEDYYKKYNANVHRGIHTLSEIATTKYEEARATVAEFIHAETNEITFTSGTTESLNLLTNSLLHSERMKSHPGKIKVLTTELEHHSSFLPWAVHDIVEITFAPLDENFQIDIKKLEQLSKEIEFDFVVITLMSNVTGTIAPIKKLRELFPDAIIIGDVAQLVPHMPINVKEIDIDFLAFSGHKMYAPTGIGVLYGKAELLEYIPPLKYGGGMIAEVYKDKQTWAQVPEKHEAGTPNIEGAIGLMEAIKFIDQVGFEMIIKREEKLRQYLLAELKKIDRVVVFHPAREIAAGPVISFGIEGIHPHDVAQVLADQNIAVRAGHHCAQILHRDILKQTGSVRVSIGMYNDEKDIYILIQGVKEAIKQFA